MFPHSHLQRVGGLTAPIISFLERGREAVGGAKRRYRKDMRVFWFEEGWEPWTSILIVVPWRRGVGKEKREAVTVTCSDG